MSKAGWLSRWFGKRPAPKPHPALTDIPSQAVSSAPAPDATIAPIETDGLPFGVRAIMPQDSAALAHFLARELPEQTNHWQQGWQVLAHWQGELCGFARLSETHELLIHVSPAMRQLGIGTLLFQHLEDDSRARQVAQLQAISNEHSETFLRNMGFVISPGSELAIKTLR